MKRIMLLGFVVALALCFFLFSGSAFAKEMANTTESKIPTLPTETSGDFVVINNSDRIVTDGLYFDVYYSSDDGHYIPEFTLELWDVKTNSFISSAVGNNLNYKNGKYSLIFNHQGYKLGDEFALILRDADDIIEHLDFNGYNLKPNTHARFTIDTFDYFEGANDEFIVQDLTATKLSPLAAILETNPKKVGLNLISDTGTPLKHTQVEIKLLEGKGSLITQSDDRGMIWLDSDKLTWKFLVSSKGLQPKHGTNGKVEVELPAPVVAGIQKSAVVIPVVFEPIHPSESNSEITLSFSTTANTDLSKAWSQFDLSLTNTEGVLSIFTFDLDSTTIQGLEDGQYQVSIANAKYADISLDSDSLLIQGGKGEIKGTIEPKHLLEIDKDGKPYNFSIINVQPIADKQYKGTKPMTFAVTPGESFMVKDNDTGRIETVAIDANTPTTRIVLGAGVVAGGSATIPATGDNIAMLMMGFLIAIVGTTFGFFMYLKRKKSGSKVSTLSILLAAVMVTSIFSTIASNPVAAAGEDANVGGTQPATGGATSSTPAGTFQVSDQIAVLQFGFIPNKVKSDGDLVLSASSGVTDLEDPFKFDYEPLMFYMAPSKISDTLWRKQGSGFITFERGNGVKTLYGNNPLYPDKKAEHPRDDLMKRTLDYADLSRNYDPNQKTNYFQQIIGDVLYNIDPDNPNRSLSGVGSVYVVGNGLKNMIENYISKRKDESEIDAQIISSLMFSGYLDLIKSNGVLTGDEYTAFEQMMRDKFIKGELIFFAQTVIGISIQDGGNPLNRDYAFIPFHDATEWYLYIRQSARPTDPVVQGLTANREYEAVTKGGASTSEQGNFSPYKENGNLPFTFRTYARDHYARTLKPVTDLVPISTDVSVNPFGGWGFQPWGYGDKKVGNKPKIIAELNVTVVDKNGLPTSESFTIPVKGWTEEDEKYLGDLVSANDTFIVGGMFLEHAGKQYELLSDEAARFSLIDTKDAENLNKSKLRKDVPGNDGTISIPNSVNEDTWQVELGWDTPSPMDLHIYLGGENTGFVSEVENKYEGTGEFSHAKLTLFVKAQELVQDDSIQSRFTVPEWRLSLYRDNISPDGTNQSRFILKLPIGTFRNPSLSPSGMQQFSLISPNLASTPWLESKAKLFNDTPVKNITVYNPNASFFEAGDILAIKDNSSVSNIKLAEWINGYSLFNGKIGTTLKGEVIEGPIVNQSTSVSYGVKAPYSSYIYKETRWNVACGENGCWSYPYTWTGTAIPSYQTADYDVNVSFKNYIPKDSPTPKKFTPVTFSDNGLYWQTKQSDGVILVNPEVMMAFDDANGNTSIVFAAGQKLRPIQPVAYNQARFINLNIKPEVTGLSVATDSRAKELQTKLGSNKEVIYKGSSVTTSFENQGELEIKTYALDIGSSVLKNIWNPGTQYDTDEINESFLKEYATKNEATGKWEITFDLYGNFVINNQDFGGVSEKITVEEKSRAVIEYKLEVRGGRLVGVNGSRDLNSLPQDLKDALARMNISTTDNIFNTFERSAGDILTEDHIANLGNMVRGTDDLAVGKGWYSEDVTTLVVREYITTFSIPNYVYVDKLPMELTPDLAVPVNKNEFFNVGAYGHVKLKVKAGNAEMTADSSMGQIGIKKEHQFIISNVSVLDMFQ